MRHLSRYLAALIAAVLMTLGLASTASAHTSAVTGSAVCQDDGTYVVTWTYAATNVPAGVEAETKAMNTNKGTLAPVDGVLKGGQVFLSVWAEHQINVPGAPTKTGNWTAQFKTVGLPGDTRGAVTTMVQTDWKGGPSEDPVGRVMLDGSCKPKAPEPQTKTISGAGEWGAEQPNCTEKIVTHTRTPWTAQAVSTDGGATWTEVPGTRVDGEPVTETVREMTDRECGIIPDQPEPRYDTKTWQTQVCADPRDGTAIVTTHAQDLIYKPVWDAESWTWVEGPAENLGDERVAGTEVVVAQDCDPIVLDVEPFDVWFHDGCGVSDDSVNTPADTDWYSFVTINEDSDSTLVRSVPVPGYAFPEGFVTEWGYQFTDEPCDDVTPGPEPTTPPAVDTPPTIATPVPPAGSNVVAAAPTAAKVVAPGTVLATTGSDAAKVVAVATALIILGTMLLIRRRRQH